MQRRRHSLPETLMTPVRPLWTLALLTLSVGPAQAGVFEAVVVHTAEGDVSQSVTVSGQGEVAVRWQGPTRLRQLTGSATAAELAELERTVREARLGDGVPDPFSLGPQTAWLSVVSASPVLQGQAGGALHEAAPSLRARLEPLREVARRIAARLLESPPASAGELTGRVDVRGASTFLELASGRRYRIRPYEVSHWFQSLHGQQVRVEGEITMDSLLFRRVRVDALLDPVRERLRGERIHPTTLRVGGRDVQLSGDPQVLAALTQLTGELTLLGAVRSTPDGPSSMVVVGVVARMAEAWPPLRRGDEVLVLTHHAQQGFRVERTLDGAETMVPRSALDTGALGGLTGALGH
jgi:hypothetical protein